MDRRARILGAAVPNFEIVSPESYVPNLFAKLIVDNPGAFVVVDCFADIHEPVEGRDQGIEMRRFVRDLRQRYENHGCSGIVIDHMNREGTFSGSNQKRATFRQMIEVQCNDANSLAAVKRQKVTSFKMGEAEKFPAFYVDFNFAPDSFRAQFSSVETLASSRIDSATRDAESLVARILPGKQYSRLELQHHCDLSKDRTARAIAKLRADDPSQIIVLGEGKLTRYMLAAPAPSPV